MTTLDRAERRETLLREMAVADPAAGAEWSLSVPAGSLWIAQAVYAEYQASAIVATRVPSLVVSSPDAVWARVITAAGATANQNARYSWLRDYGDHFNIAADPTRNQSLPRLLLRPGTSIASSTIARDVGDQWHAVILSVVEVIENTPEIAAEYERMLFEGRRSPAIPLVDPGW